MTVSSGAGTCLPLASVRARRYPPWADELRGAGSGGAGGAVHPLPFSKGCREGAGAKGVQTVKSALLFKFSLFHREIRTISGKSALL